MSIFKSFKKFFVCNDLVVTKVCDCLLMQELDLRLVAVKGIGQDHAKFSPVGKLLIKT